MRSGKNKDDPLERKELMFDPDCRRFTEFFSKSSINNLWYCLGDFVNTYTQEYTFSAEDYSVTSKILRSEGKSALNPSLLINIEAIYTSNSQY